MICIVPARAGSSLKDKNLRRFGEDSRPLLARALEKCISVFGKNRVIALVDSARLAECAQSAGAFAVLDEAVPAHEDVSARLWRLAAADFMRIHAGTQIALVQCTSPHTSEETLERFAELAPKPERVAFPRSENSPRRNPDRRSPRHRPRGGFHRKRNLSAHGTRKNISRRTRIESGKQKMENDGREGKRALHLEA